MKNDSLVSIALTTYNGEKFIREQLNSIYSQTYQNIEVIVTDDRSTDNTVAILKEFRKSHGLKYSVNKENLGFVKNFERAVGECKGDYIALADQDDIWLPHKLQVLLQEIGTSSLICSDAQLIDENNNIIAESFQEFSTNYIQTDDQFRFFVFRNFVTGCTTLIKKEVIEKALPIPHGIRYHDWWFALIASTLGGVAYCKQSLIQYRQHTAQDTGAGQTMNIGRKISEAAENKKKGILDKEIAKTEGQLSYIGFTDDQKKIIHDRLTFFKNRRDSLIHFKAFKVALKHQKYLLAGRNIIYKIVFILASLIK